MTNSFIEKICSDIFNNQDFTEFDNKNILITGANGLLGGMIADFFAYLNTKKNFNITLYLTSKSSLLDASRIQHLLGNDKIKYFSRDLSKLNDWSKDINVKIDYCFYCAGYATPSKFIGRPIENLNVNIGGLNQILDFVFNDNPKAHFLYISSAEIYSANNNSKLYEEDDIINVEVANKRNSYKIGKIAGEILVNDFVDKGFKASSIRTTVCYGPGVLEDDSRVLSDLVKKGVFNDKIQLMDDGQSTRNFIYISDFCLMIFNIIKTCKSKVYNVNGDTKRSILEITQIISEILNKPVVLGNKANIITENTTRSVSMSINRYENEFGKHNFKSIEEGVKEFTEWYKTILNN